MGGEQRSEEKRPPTGHPHVSKPRACDPFVSIPFSETSVQTSGIKLYFPLVIWSFRDTWVLCSEKGGYPLRLNIGRERKEKSQVAFLVALDTQAFSQHWEKSAFLKSTIKKMTRVKQKLSTQTQVQFHPHLSNQTVKPWKCLLPDEKNNS